MTVRRIISGEFRKGQKQALKKRETLVNLFLAMAYGSKSIILEVCHERKKSKAIIAGKT